METIKTVKDIVGTFNSANEVSDEERKQVIKLVENTDLRDYYSDLKTEAAANEIVLVLHEYAEAKGKSNTSEELIELKNDMGYGGTFPAFYKGDASKYNDRDCSLDFFKS